jgi:hypothetical protein
MTGGTYRGPVGVGRQRKAVRIVQVLLVLIAAGLLLFAGYSLGVRSGYEQGRQGGELGAPQPPTFSQVVVPAALGMGALTAAFLLQSPGGVRIPSPARLDELAGRAEATAVDRAGIAAAEVSRAPRDSEGGEG